MSFCTYKMYSHKHDMKICPSTPHTRCVHTSVTHILNALASTVLGMGTCNRRCLPGLDLPVDSFFFFVGGGGVNENIKGTGNLTQISCIKKLLLSSLCNLSVCAFFDSLDIQDLMCSFCLVGNPL